MASLNLEQREAFLDVLGFLNDPSRKYHRVSGGAGTGKSYFISKVATDILKHIEPEYALWDVAITATTNKAAAVLKDALPKYHGDIQTIYSFMNLRVQSNFNDGTQKIVPTRNWIVHDRVLIIIDEASMVNKSLWNYLEMGTTSKCKILFVGDKNQLSPVKEDISPVYKNKISESMLIHPVRNANEPALMALCDMAKDTVLTGKFHPIEEVPGVIDFVDGTELRGLLEREYHKEDPSKRVLCYTNKRVIDYNSFIRDIRGYKDNYEVGEIVINNSSAELTDKTRLYTDQVVEIIKKGKPYSDYDLVPGHEVDMIELTVRDVTNLTEYDIVVFADPQDKHEVMNYWKSRKKWDRFFKVKENFPDLRSAASSTTHKAQGSTYDSVIVDLADIGKSTNREQTARLQYVALSRPRSRIYIRGKLPERYFR